MKLNKQYFKDIHEAMDDIIKPVDENLWTTFTGTYGRHLAEYNGAAKLLIHQMKQYQEDEKNEDE